MAAKKERAAPPPKTTQKTAPKTPKPSGLSGNARAEVSADELRKLISEAAYYRAKQRGFTPGYELEDWIQAEAEVIGRLNSTGRPA